MYSDKDHFQGNTKWKTKEQEDTDVIDEEIHNLIVWNDDVNTFDWVIETLIAICNHSQVQAEQCAYIIHSKGKYAVRRGKTESLKPMKDQILERGINATIE